MSKRAKWLLISLFILWIFLTLGSFFAVQKPFSAANVLAAGNVLLDLLVAGWLTFIALAMGTWFLQRLLPINLSFGETLIFGAGLGLGALGLLSLALGLVGLFQPLVAYGVSFGLSVVFVPQAAGLFRRWRRRQPENRPGLLTTIYCLLIALFALLVALLPPTDWDGLFYHLTAPKLYLQTGSIVGGIDVPHFSFPALMEMLFAWAMLLRGDIAAKLLHTFFGLLLAGLVYLTAYRFLSKRAAWLAVLIFAGMPMVNTLAGWAYNDLALAFYQFASLYSMIQWLLLARQSSNDSASPPYWLILSGIFAGLAMGLKYTSFITPLVIGGLILWHTYRMSRVRYQGSRVRYQGSSVKYRVSSGSSHASCITHHASRITHHVSRSIITNLAIFILPALLVALPWYLKNWAFTGNPVYPFLFDWFGGQYWDNFRADSYSASGTGIGWRPVDFQGAIERVLSIEMGIKLSSTLQHYFNFGITLLTLPWLLTLGARDMNYWDGRTGPLLLLFLPLIVWAGFSRRSTNRPIALGPLLIYALAHFSFWTLGVIWSRGLWQSRLLLSGLVVLAPVGGWLWANLSDFDLPQFSLRRFVNIVVGLTLALTIVDVGLLTFKINPLSYLIGLEAREAYLTRRLGAHYAAMQQIDEVLPPEATVVFLWEPKSYYCQRDCRPDSILDTFPHLVYQHGSAGAIVQAWQQAGVTHVLIHQSGLSFVLNESPEVIDTTILADLEIRFLHPIFDVGGAYQVYELIEAQ